MFLHENEVNYHEERKKVEVENAEKEEENLLKPRVNKLKSKFGGQTKNTEPTRSDYVYDEDYYALYFDRLYARRIKELQEFYGHNFQKWLPLINRQKIMYWNLSTLKRKHLMNLLIYTIFFVIRKQKNFPRKLGDYVYRLHIALIGLFSWLQCNKCLR